MKLTFGYINTPEGQQYSTAMAAGLQKAGFNVQRQEIPAETYYDQVSKLDNNYDIFHTAWGADWPSASTVIPPLYDGRAIADGAQNYSQVNDPKVNADIDRINKITDPVKGAAEWEKVDEYLVKDIVNVVPTAYYKQTQIMRLQGRRHGLRRRDRWRRPASPVRQVTVALTGPGAPTAR